MKPIFSKPWDKHNARVVGVRTPCAQLLMALDRGAYYSTCASSGGGTSSSSVSFWRMLLLFLPKSPMKLLGMDRCLGWRLSLRAMHIPHAYILSCKPSRAPPPRKFIKAQGLRDSTMLPTVIAIAVHDSPIFRVVPRRNACMYVCS